MLQILILVITMLAKSEGIYQTVFDINQIDKTHHYYGENIQFEDGSFITSQNGQSLSGCVPFMLCSDIQIDSPYEDYFSSASTEILYNLESLYKRFNLFSVPIVGTLFYLWNVPDNNTEPIRSL